MEKFFHNKHGARDGFWDFTGEFYSGKFSRVILGQAFSNKAPGDGDRNNLSICQRTGRGSRSLRRYRILSVVRKVSFRSFCFVRL